MQDDWGASPEDRFIKRAVDFAVTCLLGAFGVVALFAFAAYALLF